jgi:hypothetical protein
MKTLPNRKTYIWERACVDGASVLVARMEMAGASAIGFRRRRDRQGTRKSVEDRASPRLL